MYYDRSYVVSSNQTPIASSRSIKAVLNYIKDFSTIDFDKDEIILCGDNIPLKGENEIIERLTDAYPVTSIVMKNNAFNISITCVPYYESWVCHK